MASMNTKLPVLILAYNRPDLVMQVLQVVQIYQPPRLYLACDGPRLHKQGDKERVNETRRIMESSVNWDCELHTLFREKNLGCAQGVYEAISWFFNHEEYGVIIEDDVVVSQDFFKLCEDLLPRYKNDMKIMQISSLNTSGRVDIPSSYVYSQVFHCWGWASWRSAWQKMDMQMTGITKTTIPYLVKRIGLFRGCMMYYYFKQLYAHLEQSTSWATRWYHSILCYDGLVICPGINLGINIGLTQGEHYKHSDAHRPEASLTLNKLNWPIIYDDSQNIDKRQKKYDTWFFIKTKWYGLLHKFSH